MKYLFKLIFPERCVFCSTPTRLHSQNPYVCEKCAANKPYLNRRAELTEEKTGHIRGISVFRYDAVRETIFKLKYDGYRQYGKIMGSLMADYVMENNIEEFLSADMLAPVPLWRDKERERGFNQAELLAEAISEKIGVPCVGRLIFRVKNTVPQNGLGHDDRRANMIGAFKLNGKYSVEGKRIVLVDDIYTTGSTVFECAKELFGHGAGDVVYLALSSPGKHFEMPEYEGRELLKEIDIDKI